MIDHAQQLDPLHDAVGMPLTTTTRLESLDVFRGLTMAAMVIVNNPGDWGHVYRPLLHAEWDGWTPTDLIFPFFLFIVGITLTLSRSQTSWPRLLRRTALLIGLGLLLVGFPSYQPDTMRIPGVLQRIGLCYFTAAIILRRTSSVRGASGGHVGADVGILGAVDVGATRRRRSVAGGQSWRARGSRPARRASLEARLGSRGPSQHDSRRRDDAAGRGHGHPDALREHPAAVVMTLLAGGAAGIVIGLAWNLAFPINKSLWTSSYVFFTAGLAAIILAGCYAAVDAWPSALSRAVARPFVILGTNAILLYVLSSLIARLLNVVNIGGVTAKARLYDGWFVPIASPINASLLFAIANLALLFMVLLPLYRRRIFLKL